MMKRKASIQPFCAHIPRGSSTTFSIDGSESKYQEVCLEPQAWSGPSPRLAGCKVKTDLYSMQCGSMFRESVQRCHQSLQMCQWQGLGDDGLNEVRCALPILLASGVSDLTQSTATSRKLADQYRLLLLILKESYTHTVMLTEMEGVSARCKHAAACSQPAHRWLMRSSYEIDTEARISCALRA